MKRLANATDEDSATADKHLYDLGKLLAKTKDEDLNIFEDGEYMMALRDGYLQRAQTDKEKAQTTKTTADVYKQGVDKGKLTQSQLNIDELWIQRGDMIIEAVNVGFDDQNQEVHQDLYNIGHRLSRLKSHELDVFKDLKYMVIVRDYYKRH